MIMLACNTVACLKFLIFSFQCNIHHKSIIRGITQQ